MRKYKFVVYGKLPGLNEYLKAERIFRNGHCNGNDMKQECQLIISNAIRSQLKRLKINRPIRIIYDFYEQNRKRDLDNISSTAHKFIQDSLVRCGVLANDGWEYITGFEDHFFVDRHNPRIEVTLMDVSDKCQPG